jgi:hypothetical protein
VATVIFVHPSLLVRNVKEIVALGKARPGELNYAPGAPRSSQARPRRSATIADDTALWAGVIREMGSRAE